MKGSKARLDRMVWSWLLAAAACLASGAAMARCPAASSIAPGDGDVPCYMKVQPIDVCLIGGTCAPFNTTSQIGLPTGAPATGTTPAIPAAGYYFNAMGTQVFDNAMSPNPIGFTVNPSSGVVIPPAQNPPQTGGVDITRVLMRHIGVELVWMPMTVLNTSNANFNSLSVMPTTTTVASCNGFISGTTLTITSSCTGSPGTLAVSDGLSSSAATIAAGTIITGLVTGTGGTGTYTVNPSQTVGSSRKPVAITASTTTLSSPDFLTLMDQAAPTPPATTPCAIFQMVVDTSGNISPPCLAPNTIDTYLSADPTTVNLAYINNLQPAGAGGTLYGFSWICNNGVVIGGNTFFAPTPLQARPDTIAHEMLHDLCLDHVSYGAGPWAPPTHPTASPPSYDAPFGVAPPIPANPLLGECDSAYPACGANLMTTGSLRTEPTVPCVLAPLLSTTVTPPSGCLPPANGLTAQSPGLYTGTADQVTPLNTSFGYGTATQQQLPVSQQQKVLAGFPPSGSGLLFSNNPAVIPPILYSGLVNPIQHSGLVNPIPRETTKAQLGTGGSSTDRVIFDLSGPADGTPGETLVGWVLTLPQEQTFARHGGFDILSQSRHDLVQDVNYYPSSIDNPLKRNIAYQPGADNNVDNPSIGAADPSPCAFATAECLVVKFQPPGLGEHDSISFSKSILSGDAPITNDDLCKAKITYIFSDGFVTTSNFGRCPAASLPLIASSWHPDLYVAPHVVKSNLLLAGLGTNQSQGCTPDPVTGLCGDPSKTPPKDVDHTQEGGQTGTTCNNGTIMGTIPGPNVTVSLGQTCHYANCEFLGALTVNGGSAYLDNCVVDGNITQIAGTLSLINTHVSVGNIQISQAASAFRVNGAQIGGNLTIQGLGPSAPGTFDTVCGTQVGGSITVSNNNQTSIEIGGQPTCPGNTITGHLTCTGNLPAPTGDLSGGGNTANGGKSGQCAGF